MRSAVSTSETHLSNGVSSSPTKQDLRRERELFKFYKPGDNSVDDTHVSPISPSDPHLAALCQLVTLRLNVHRAMVNLLGRDQQYTVVEPTREQYFLSQDGESNDSWMGDGGLMRKTLTLCETAINQKDVSGQHNILIIPDLTKDVRFRDRFYVTGGPKQRFYAGTALRTSTGVAIGALCIIDPTPRHGLTEEEQLFMMTMAESVMSYLEMRKSVAENNRAARMATGLDSFVAGLTLARTQAQASSVRKKMSGERTRRLPRKVFTSASSHSNEEHEKGGPTKADPLPQSNSLTPEPPQKSVAKPASPTASATINTREHTLARAAKLLTASLGLTEVGGVLFYDTVVDLNDRSYNSVQRAPASDNTVTSSDESEDDASHRHHTIASEAPVLAKSVSENGKGATLGGLKHTLTAVLLRNLIKRYPHGRTWQFDDFGVVSSDELESPVGERASTNTRKASRATAEAKQLQRHFPGVQSLIFIPLWDPIASKYFTGCVAYTTSLQRAFDQSEFNYVTTFGNSICVELSRIAALDADRRKSDFIGSISHELRSPLHGLLASAEFLAETDCDDFQRQLVDTVRISGRSLLDVIDHVLDFSKITSLERAWKTNSNAKSDDPAAENFSNGAGSKVVDLAILAEEVIESVHAGRMSANFSQDEEVISTLELTRTQSGDSKHPGNVTTLLDIDPGDYTFTTQPGALRRVVQNLYNNACKYTRNGTITVRLEIMDDDEDHATTITGNPNARNVVILISDTGKGMSEDYLANHLYKPFTQENDLSSGTGLGLSIVRSIVNMLGGRIDIRSKCGQGTQVRVNVPLVRSKPTDRISGPGCNEIQDLRTQHSGKSVGLFGFTAENEDIGKTLETYIEGWYGLHCVQDWSASTTPDIVIVDELHLPELQQAGLASSTRNIVLSATSSPQRVEKASQGAIQFLLKPFGPSKLAKSLQKSLESLDCRRISVDLDGQRFKTSNNWNRPLPSKNNLSSSSVPRLTDMPTISAAVNEASTTSTDSSPFSDGKPSPNSFANSFARPRVLMVDDNSINLMLLKTFMKKRFLLADTACNGQLAVEAATSTYYDIILMDISMPVMNGFEATREIRRLEASRRRRNPSCSQRKNDLESNEHIRPAYIIALTGLGSASDQNEAMASGVDRFLTKPVSFNELGKFLDTWKGVTDCGDDTSLLHV